jgi:hypothetical protein
MPDEINESAPGDKQSTANAGQQRQATTKQQPPAAPENLGPPEHPVK